MKQWVIETFFFSFYRSTVGLLVCPHAVKHSKMDTLLVLNTSHPRKEILGNIKHHCCKESATERKTSYPIGN